MGQEGDTELKYVVLNVVLICLLLSLTGCGADKKAGRENRAGSGQEGEAVYQGEGADFMQAGKSDDKPYTADTKMSEVISEPLFGDYGRLIFPTDSGYMSWYNKVVTPNRK